ncbi:MAG: glycosyltransferase [Vicinamibacterales bacterium]
MPRVLIVTSMWLPYLAADAQRARMLATGLPAEGWDVEVLVPADTFQLREHFEQHADLMATRTVVHRAPVEWAAAFKLINSRSLAWRAYRPLRALGDRLLGGKRFDLVYITCAQHAWLHLGAHWRRRFDVPIVLDFHDPWYVPTVGKPTHISPWKARVSNSLARVLERRAIGAASGLVSVSPGYLATLNDRYRGSGFDALRPDRQAVIPFGVDPSDLDAARRITAPNDDPPPRDSLTVVYTGAGSTIMERSFREICRLIAEVRPATRFPAAGWRILLFGTEPSAPEGGGVLARVAAEMGLSDMVREHPARLGYLDALHRVVTADGLLVLGVDDPAYMPSKLFLYGLTGKPILACVCEDSVVCGYFERAPGLGELLRFPEGSRPCAEGANVMGAFLDAVAGRQTVDRRDVLREWLAPAMARQHVTLFRTITQSVPPPR